MRRAVLVVLTLVVVVSSSSYVDTTAPALPTIGARLPALMLWAWERPTDLRGLDSRTGVAFFAQSILIADGVVVTPRRNPLRVSSHTPLVAVTRVESPHAAAPSLNDGDLEAAVLAIVNSASLPQVVAVQIDFDAAQSERAFYRRFLTRVREALPSAIPLSMTALASWCASDDWLDGLPIDEAVPMLFRMGPLNAPYRSIGVRPASAAASCRRAVGISLDEPLTVFSRGRRVYVFNSEPWTPPLVARAQEMVR